MLVFFIWREDRYPILTPKSKLVLGGLRFLSQYLEDIMNLCYNIIVRKLYDKKYNYL